MVLIEWSLALSVDIEVIDTQHKKLLNYMNELYDAIVQRREHDILIRLFNDLEEYTRTHFTFEEVYFDEFNYDGKDAHVLQHKEFIKQLGVMKQEIFNNSKDVEDLLDFLVNWLMHHIKGTDHGYVKCFHEHGIV